MKKNTTIIIGAFILSALIYSCANQGAPGGGPEDKEPPSVEYSTPSHGQVNVDPRARIVVEFSEWININVASAVTMYPPPPGGIAVRGAKNSITVTPKEPLSANTTYHLVINTALKDLRGNSPASPINIVFSTGSVLDSGRLGGIITPLAKLTASPRVALFREDGEWEDSRYFAAPDYAAHSDSAGEFSFSYLREGNYRVVAFIDQYRVGRIHHGDSVFTSVEKTIAITKTEQTVRLYPASADTSITLTDTSSLRDEKSEIAGDADTAGSTDRKARPKEPDTVSLELKSHTPSGTVSLMPELRMIWNRPARVTISSVSAIDTAGTDTVVFFRAAVSGYSDTTLFAPAKRLRPGAVYTVTLDPQTVRDERGNQAVVREKKDAPDKDGKGRGGRGRRGGNSADKETSDAGKTDSADTKDVDSKDALQTASQSADDKDIDSVDTVASNDTAMIDAATDSANTAADTVKVPMITITLRTVSPDSICYRLQGGAECLEPNDKRKWVYSPIGSSERFFAPDKSGTFTFDSIPASKGTLHWFIDDNGDNRITPGKLAPWRSPERFFMPPDTIEAKARWEIEDVRIKGGCE